MNNTSNYYQLYLNDVMTLAQTLVIKSSESAEALNKFVTDYHGAAAVDPLYPTTWKYYLNLSGERHPIDPQIWVTSLDTLERIEFTKANLEVHRATARGYVYGTRPYRELIAAYPQQETLILGILYPIDINTAIAADNGTILGYPPGLVEPNEYSFVSKLQAWIVGYQERWTNHQFNLSDELYSATTLGIMYLNLVPAILSIRLEACKTNEAHSFHVRQYLASHGLLDAYVDQMTTKQALFFYRNIAYIERNVGKRDIFSWIVEHIMTERLLPLAEYTMRHDLSKQPEEIYPQLVFHKTPINLGYSADLVDNISLLQMLNKQDKLARDNVLYKPEVLPGIQEAMENSLSNVVLTKTLESSVIDYSNSSPYSLDEILINHWLSLSTAGLYTAFIGVTNPRTGERIPLTVKEAYTFLWYAFTKTVGIELITIPEVYAKRVQRIPTALPKYPSLSAGAVVPNPNPVPGSVGDLMSVVDQTLISEAVAVQALSMQPTLKNILSTEAFYNLCKEIYNAAQMQRNLVASQEHAVARGMVQGMVSRIYSDNICQLVPNAQTYASWFAERNIDIGGLTNNDLTVIYQDLVRQATGLALGTTNSLKDLQAAMLKMLTQLSSYSVQIVGQINGTDIKQTDWTAVRVGHMAAKYSEHLLLPDTTSTVQQVRGHSHERRKILLGGSHINGSYRTYLHSRVRIKVTPRVQRGTVREVRPLRLQLNPVDARPRISVPTNTVGVIPVMGIPEYLLLNYTQRQTFKDVYNGGYSTIAPVDDGSAETEANNATLYMVPRYVAPNYAT